MPRAIRIRVFPDPRNNGSHLVQWRVDGRRRTQSFAAKSAADLAARELRRDLEERGLEAQRVNMVEWRRWLDFRARIGGADLGEVATVWIEHRAKVTREGMTVAEAVARYRDLRSAEGIAGDTWLQLKKITGRLEGAYGSRPLGALSADDLRAWLARLSGDEGLSPVTVVNHLKQVRAFLNRCVREGWVSGCVADRVAAPKVEAEEVTVIAAEDAAKLFAANADEPVTMRLALEAFGGLRYSSACRIRKEDINWTERGILLPGALHKSGRRHYLEGMPANLWAWLDKWRDDPRPWAMTTRQILSAKGAAFERAGVANPGNVLRHSFCSYHIAANADAAKTAVLLQHTNQAMLYRHYKGVATKADAEAYFAIVPGAKKAPVA